MIKLENMLVPLSHYRKWLIPFQDEKTREFIQKARLVHGNSYDYRFVKYTKNYEKICIICKLHGEFWQTPGNHLSKQRCPICGKISRISLRSSNTNEFILKSKKVFGDYYDYSKVDYKNSIKKVCIICPKHGEFWQSPHDHISGKGCPECGRISIIEANRKDTNWFIEQSKRIFGDYYDYSRVDYKNSTEKVCIICPEHGEFWQIPNYHLRGSGCPECGKLSAIKANTKDTSQFIEQSKKVFGDYYDYSKVDYKSSTERVCIICPKHGEFWQVPNNHLMGHGCPECGKELVSKKMTCDTKDFLEKCHKAHGDFYDYSKTVYTDCKTSVTIICPEHGEFQQLPTVHVLGSGCPICGQRNLCESYVGEWLLKNNIEYTHLYPILDLIRNSRHVIIDYRIKIKDKILMAEYNGDYHYKFNKYMHKNNIENFKNQLMRDEKVRLYCKKHSITLIEIPYIFNTRQSIFEFLDKVLLQNIDPKTLVDYESLFERPSDYIPYSENENN